MQKKITYFFLFLLCSTCVQAQQQVAVDRLLASIRKITTVITKDTTIQAACKKELKEFAKAITINNKNALTKDAVQKLLNSAQLFTGSINESWLQKCNIKQMNGLVDSATQLMLELDKLNTDTEVVRIKLTGNGASGWTLDADSISIRKLVIKDSMGYVQALLYPRSNNPVRLVTERSNLRDSIFKIEQFQNKLISIQLPVNETLGNISGSQLVKDNIETQLTKLHNRNTVLLILMTLLFFLTLATVLFYSRAFKKLSAAFGQIAGNLNQLQTEKPMEEMNNDTALIIPVDLPEPEPINEVIMEPEKEMPAALPVKDPYFICEIMMTAGPRKKPMSDPHSDKDLGEDVCGFISTTREVFTWFLDGTSDDDSWKDPVTKKEYFSSRLLAQSIGERLRSSFIANGPGPLVPMIEDAINQVKQDWLQIIEQLPEEEKQRLKSRIESKISPQCSTTALIGHLQSNGDLSACRTGDSQMFLFDGVTDELTWLETPLMGKSENGVDRIFFRLQFDQDNHFEIVSNKPVFDVAEEKNINTIISFSDGVGQATEQLLREQYKNDPVKIKRDIIYQLQGTGDDKSICFIERR